MATIDDLIEQATVSAIIEDRDNGTDLVSEVRLTITIPIELLDLISTGSTRSHVLVRDFLKPAVDTAP
ncbi:MAG: hypothetical protein CL484_12145 [Acidobacteria bacterium]|nr:hypothetical protein [Acidobacteriota bacterium]